MAPVMSGDGGRDAVRRPEMMRQEIELQVEWLTDIVATIEDMVERFHAPERSTAALDTNGWRRVTTSG